jgi:hypothetical protein
VTDPYDACPIEVFRALGHVAIRWKDDAGDAVMFPEEWLPVVAQLLRDIQRDINWDGVVADE